MIKRGEGRIGITIQANAQKVRYVIEKIEKNEYLELSVDDDEVVNLLGMREHNWFPKVVNKELPITNNLDNRGQYDCISEKLLEEKLEKIPKDIKKETSKIGKRKSVEKKKRENKGKRENNEAVSNLY